jgi:ribonuclease P protein component
MLGKKNRLNKNKEFNAIWKQGLSAYGPNLGLKIMPNGLEYGRFAFLISKKVSKRAVVRNLIKRRLREIIRLDWLNIKGYDAVIVVLPKAADKDFQQLRDEVKFLFKKLKIS